MSERGVHFLLDPGGAAGSASLPVNGGEGVWLFPEEGEYVRAMAALAAREAALPRGAGVPDEVFFHLYAYEVLERMEEQRRAAAAAEAGVRVLIFPFWPAALFEAAGIAAHGALEIQALLPRPVSVFFRERDADTVAAEARRVLGGVRFDPPAYTRAVREAAAARGWRPAGGCAEGS